MINTMKTSVLVPFTVLASAAAAFAQGPLTPPPGAPAPVMKSLDQIEARTPINTLPGDATATYIITLPGSYYLTGPISGNSGKVGIRIEAVNVTIDLNGFALDSVAGSTKGITANATGGPIVIRNGILRFWPNAIDISGGADFLMKDLQITNTSSSAVLLDAHGTMENVSIRSAVASGITATATSRVKINNCRIDGVTGSQAMGISAQIADIQGCYITNVTGGGGAVRGILAQNGSVDRCTVRTITGGGAGNYAVIADRVSNSVVTEVQSTGTGGFATGIQATSSVSNCQVSGIASGGTVAYGIHSARRVADCDVSSVSGGSVINVGIEQCTQVTDNKVRLCPLGIRGTADAQITKNYVSDSTSTGIISGSNGVVTDNRLANTDNTGTGILMQGTAARCEANHVSGFLTGLSASSSVIVIRNSAGGNTTNYSTSGAVIVTPAAMGTNPFSNISQ
jgi:hypothetical protein